MKTSIDVSRQTQQFYAQANMLLRNFRYCMPYSASAMIVTHGIPSFYELLRKCIHNFSERISSSRNSIIKAC